jgi:hypothetical protein
MTTNSSISVNPFLRARGHFIGPVPSAKRRTEKENQSSLNNQNRK